jgi:hypothetical protein
MTIKKAKFDGKIGIWPFTEEVAAQRASVNRARGTIVTKNIESVSRSVIKDFLLRLVIPATKKQWPARDRGHFITIQQANARPHVPSPLPDDEDIIPAGTTNGWNIRLSNQPPNSPDTNVLDLGFFSAIQAIQ